MFDELDTTSEAAIDGQVKFLQGIADDLIVIDASGKVKAKPGVTPEQMLYAIEQIRKIQAIYDERAKAHRALAREIDVARKDAAELRDMTEKMNKKYGGKMFPKWYLKMLGCK